MENREIQYISTSTIHPSNECHNERNQRIELAVWDLMLLPHQYMQRGLIYYYPKDQETTCMDMIISQLKTSLSRTLDHFYPFAGRLATTKHCDNMKDDDNTTFTSVYIDCNSSGVEFIHAVADVTVSDIVMPTYIPHIVRSFFTLKGVMNYEGQSLPLLSVQVTELIDGIFIGCSINHSVCDGSSFWHFFNLWSEISRGDASSDNNISCPPVLKRWFPRNADYPIRLPFSIDDKHFVEKYRYTTPPKFEVRIFHFTPEYIAKLKAKANSMSERESHTDMIVSSFQALLAHIWIAVTRARRLDPEEMTSYQLVVGNRARLNPPLPNNYFGNSFLIGEATSKVSDLLERGIRWGALLLKKVVMSYDDTKIRSYCEAWMDKPELLVLNDKVSANTLMTGGSPRFNMYGNNFGWGDPVVVRGGISNKRPGEITAIPGSVHGSVDLEVYHSFETLKAMGDDVEFIDAVQKSSR
ncbi:hypothetical protein MKW94_014401 [Papaver nudicaule]|uniref:Uncharacterized protein n=1 Tax=Papaver nudicaule TaxID=74823 RepID=A0AA41S0P3_PAPNU|nr:hypothetical protein [Papaver nudicaule]